MLIPSPARSVARRGPPRRIFPLSFFLFAALTAGLLPVPALGGVIGWGRSREAPSGWSFRARGGAILEIDGGVRETTRPYYELIGRDAEGEYYRLDDMGLDARLGAVGGELGWSGRFFRLGMGLLYFNPTSRAAALRDYYIGIADTIEYEGKEYEYLMIPAGERFIADLDGFLIDLSLEFTPFSIRGGKAFELAPWLGLNLTGVAGQYRLDAGPPRGATVYENPPREYVIGGRTSGWGGIGIPAPGVGAELVIGEPGGVRLVGRGGWHFLHYRGDTRYLPFQIRNHKELSLDFDRFGWELSLEVPLSPRSELFFGVNWQAIKAEAEAKAMARSAEEIEEMREKFDKEMDFKLSLLAGFVGLRF